MSPYYFFSIFNMSSYWKTKIWNDFPKIIKIKWICLFFNKQWSTILKYVYFIMF